jgi:hypothetical protein
MRIATLPANIHIESLQIQSRSANHHTVTFSGYVGSVQQNRLSLRGLKKGGGGNVHLHCHSILAISKFHIYHKAHSVTQTMNKYKRTTTCVKSMTYAMNKSPIICFKMTPINYTGMIHLLTDISDNKPDTVYVNKQIKRIIHNTSVCPT